MVSVRNFQGKSEKHDQGRIDAVGPAFPGIMFKEEAQCRGRNPLGENPSGMEDPLADRVGHS